MNNKVVLITGGSSGLGKAIGIYLAEKGFRVYGTTRNKQKHDGFTAFPLLEMDVRDPVSVQNAIQALLKKDGRIDVLVNNAGVGITGPLEEIPHTEVLNAFDTNFNGPIHVMKAVLPQMREQRSGLVINITSIAGYMGLPYRGIYAATKGALGIISEAIRLETKEFGIRITTLAPGDFATNIASGRFHAPVKEGSPYAKTYGKVLLAIDKDVNNGGHPLEVAKKVYAIMRAKNPKVHYTVGSNLQRLSVKLKRILPGKWFERLLENHIKE